MTPRPQAGPFARRMAPLALLAALVVGVVLPAVYQSEALKERAGEAAVWARHLASRLEDLARERPALWPYDVERLNELAWPLVTAPVHAHVRLDAAGRDAVFEAGPHGRPDELSAWAVVRQDDRAAGRVEVRVEAADTWRAVRLLWIGASVAGLVLGAALFFLPLWTVRRGDERDAALWTALEAANATLEARVEARTLELQARERQLSELGARLVAVQEEERARLSRDLHDDLGQILTGLRLRLTSLDAVARVHPAAAANLDAALGAVDEAVEEVRRLAHRLRPPALDALGLVAALRAHAERWADAAGLRLDLAVEAVEPPAVAAEVLFRVAQEALTNVARHARARVVRLGLDAFDDGWRLVVEDDGRGLPPGTPTKGLGLVGARERVEAAGGYLDLEAAAGGGLRLVAWLPGE
jgi:signal transduction histidine kinase